MVRFWESTAHMVSTGFTKRKYAIQLFAIYNYTNVCLYTNTKIQSNNQDWLPDLLLPNGQVGSKEKLYSYYESMIVNVMIVNVNIEHAMDGLYQNTHITNP